MSGDIRLLTRFLKTVLFMTFLVATDITDITLIFDQVLSGDIFFFSPPRRPRNLVQLCDRDDPFILGKRILFFDTGLSQILKRIL